MIVAVEDGVGCVHAGPVIIICAIYQQVGVAIVIDIGKSQVSIIHALKDLARIGQDAVVIEVQPGDLLPRADFLASKRQVQVAIQVHIGPGGGRNR